MSTIDSTGLMKIILNLATWMDLIDTKVGPVAQMAQYFTSAYIIHLKYVHIYMYSLYIISVIKLIL